MLKQVGLIALVLWLLGLPSVYILYRFRKLQSIRQLRPRRLAVLYVAFGLYALYLYVVGTRVLDATDPNAKQFQLYREARRGQTPNPDPIEASTTAAAHLNRSTAPHAPLDSANFSSLFYDPYHYLCHAWAEVYATVSAFDRRQLSWGAILHGMRAYAITPLTAAVALLRHSAFSLTWWRSVLAAAGTLVGDIRSFRGEVRIRALWWPAEDALTCVVLALTQSLVATLFYGGFCVHTNAMWLRGAAALRRRRQRAAVDAVLRGVSAGAQALRHASAQQRANAVGMNAAQPVASDNPLVEETAHIVGSSGGGVSSPTPSSGGAAAATAGGALLPSSSSGSSHRWSGAPVVLRHLPQAPVRNQSSLVSPEGFTGNIRPFQPPHDSSGSSGRLISSSLEGREEAGRRQSGVGSGVGIAMSNDSATISPPPMATAHHVEAFLHANSNGRHLYGAAGHDAAEVSYGSDLREGDAFTAATGTRGIGRDDISQVHQLPTWVVAVLIACPFLVICAVQLTAVQLSRTYYAHYTHSARYASEEDPFNRHDAALLVILCPPLVSAVATIGFLAILFEYAAFQRYKRQHPMYQIVMDAETPFGEGEGGMVTDPPILSAAAAATAGMTSSLHPLESPTSTVPVISPIPHRLAEDATHAATSAGSPLLAAMISSDVTTAYPPPPPPPQQHPRSPSSSHDVAEGTAHPPPAHASGVNSPSSSKASSTIPTTTGHRSSEGEDVVRGAEKRRHVKRAHSGCSSSSGRGGEGGGLSTTRKSLQNVLRAPVQEGAFGSGKHVNRYLGAVPRPVFVHAMLASLSHMALVLSPSAPVLWCLALCITTGAGAKMMHYYTWQPVHWLCTEYCKLCGRSVFTVFFSPSFTPFDLDKDEAEMDAEERVEDAMGPETDLQAATEAAAVAAATGVPTPDVVIDLKRVRTDVPIEEVVKATTQSNGSGGSGSVHLRQDPAASPALVTPTVAVPAKKKINPMRFWGSIAAKVRREWEGRSAAASPPASQVSSEANGATHSPSGGNVTVPPPAVAAAALPQVAVAAPLPETSTHNKDTAAAAAAKHHAEDVGMPLPVSAAAMLPTPLARHRTGVLGASGFAGGGVSTFTTGDLRGSILLTSPQAAQSPAVVRRGDDATRRHGSNPISNSLDDDDTSPMLPNAGAAAARSFHTHDKSSSSHSHRSSSSSGTGAKDPTIEDLGAVLMVDTEGNQYIINGGGSSDCNETSINASSSHTNNNNNVNHKGSGSNHTGENADGTGSSATSSAFDSSSFAPLTTSFNIQNNSTLHRQLLEEEESFHRFLDAIERNGDDTVTLQKLLRGHGKNLVDRRDSKGRTALHHATLGGFVNGVQFLLGLGANPNELDAEGEAPLHMAVQDHTGATRRNQTAVHRLSVAANLLTQVTGQRTTPLAAAMTQHRMLPPTAAASLRRPTKGLIVALVEGGADVNLPTGVTGLTPLHFAIIKNEIGVMNTLLRLGANPIDFLDEGGPTEAAPVLHHKDDACASDAASQTLDGRASSTATAAFDPSSLQASEQHTGTGSGEAGNGPHHPQEAHAWTTRCPCTLTWAETHLSHAGIPSAAEFRKSPVMLAAELNADIAITSMLTALSLAREQGLDFGSNATGRRTEAALTSPTSPSTAGGAAASFGSATRPSLLEILLPRCEDHQLSVLQVALALGHAATVYALLQYLNEESNPGLACPLRSSLAHRDGRTRAGSTASATAEQRASGRGQERHHGRSRHAHHTGSHKSNSARLRRQQRVLEAGVVPPSATHTRRFTCSRELQCEHERKTMFHFAALGDSTEALAYLLEVGFHAPDFVPAQSDFTWTDTAWHTQRHNANWHRLTTPSSAALGSASTGGGHGEHSATDGSEYEDVEEEEPRDAEATPHALSTANVEEGEVETAPLPGFGECPHGAKTREWILSSAKEEGSPISPNTQGPATTTGAAAAASVTVSSPTTSPSAQEVEPSLASASTTASLGGATQRQQRKLLRMRHKQHAFVASVMQLVAQRPGMLSKRRQFALAMQQRQRLPSATNSSGSTGASHGATNFSSLANRSGSPPARAGGGSGLRYGAVHVAGTNAIVRPSGASRLMNRNHIAPHDPASTNGLRSGGGGGREASARRDVPTTEEAAAQEKMSFGAAVVKLRQRVPGVPIDLAHMEQLENAVDDACISGGLTEAEKKLTQRALLVVSQRLWLLDQAEKRYAGASVYAQAQHPPASSTGSAAPHSPPSLTAQSVSAHATDTTVSQTTATAASLASNSVTPSESHSLLDVADVTFPLTANDVHATLAAVTTPTTAPAAPLFVDLGNEDIVLSYIAVCLNQCDARGMTPLHYAIVNQNANMVYVLCIYGARFIFTSRDTQRALTGPQVPGDVPVGDFDGAIRTPVLPPASVDHSNLFTSSMATATALLALSPPPTSPVTVGESTQLAASQASAQSGQHLPSSAPSVEGGRMDLPPRVPSTGNVSDLSAQSHGAASPTFTITDSASPAVAGHLSSPVVDPLASAAVEHATEAFRERQEPALQEALAVASKTEDAGEFIAALPPVDPEVLLKNSITAIDLTRGEGVHHGAGDGGASLARSFARGLPATAAEGTAVTTSDNEGMGNASFAAGALPVTTTADAAMITATLVLKQLAQTQKHATERSEAEAPEAPSDAHNEKQEREENQTADASSSPLPPRPPTLLATEQVIDAATADGGSTMAGVPTTTAPARTDGDTDPHTALRRVNSARPPLVSLVPSDGQPFSPTTADAITRATGIAMECLPTPPNATANTATEAGEPPIRTPTTAATVQQQQQQQYNMMEHEELLLRGMIEPHDVFLLHVVRNPMKAETILWAATEGMAIHARVVAERAKAAASQHAV